LGTHEKSQQRGLQFYKPAAYIERRQCFLGSPINLVSVSMLCNEGASFHFSEGNSYFDYKGHRHRLVERDGLYVLRLDEVLQADYIAASMRAVTR
jgi:hypothetical protein